MFLKVRAGNDTKKDWLGFANSISNLYFSATTEISFRQKPIMLTQAVNKSIQNMLTIIAQDSIYISKQGSLSEKSQKVLLKGLLAFKQIIVHTIAAEKKQNPKKTNAEILHSIFSDKNIRNIRAMFSIINFILDKSKSIEGDLQHAA